MASNSDSPKRPADAGPDGGPGKRARGAQTKGKAEPAAKATAAVPKAKSKAKSALAFAKPSGGPAASEAGTQQQPAAAAAAADHLVKEEKIELPAARVQKAMTEANTQLAKAKSWAKFQRSLQPTAGARSEKVPQEIALKLVTLADKRAYFDTWMAHGQSWSQVQAFEQTMYRETAGSRDVEAWPGP